MDKNHFGKSRAHEVLSEILNNRSEKVNRKVVTFVQKYNRKLKSIKNCDLSDVLKIEFLDLIFEKYQNNVINMFYDDKELKTFLLNVIFISHHDTTKKVPFKCYIFNHNK